MLLCAVIFQESSPLKAAGTMSPPPSHPKARTKRTKGKGVKHDSNQGTTGPESTVTPEQAVSKVRPLGSDRRSTGSQQTETLPKAGACAGKARRMPTPLKLETALPMQKVTAQVRLCCTPHFTTNPESFLQPWSITTQLHPLWYLRAQYTTCLGLCNQRNSAIGLSEA